MFASVKAVEAALHADAPSSDALLLLVILASYVDQRLQAFPSMATLQARSKLKSEATVRKHLQALVDASPPLLRIERDHAHNGRQTSNVYTLLLDVDGCTPAPPMDKPRRTHRHSVRPVGKSVDRRGTNRPITPQNLTPPPSKFAGSVPSKSDPLEPSKITKDASAKPEGGVDGAQVPPWKGKRYALPGAPVAASRRLPDDEEVAAGLRDLGNTLRSIRASRV